MQQNLSKVKEVLSTSSRGQDYVNEKLESGKWVLLSVKTVETQDWQKKQAGVEESHLRKDYETVYVIGRVK
jgi:hypothetical protein